jgi:hypothetical protein
MDITSFLATYSIDTTTVLYAFVFLFVVSVIVGISVVMSKSAVMSNPSNIKRITGNQTAEFDKQLSPYFKSKTSLNSQKVPENQKALVNFAPLTVLNPGYLGPTANGVFKEEEGVATALKAGARCFILPIDYHENTGLPKPAFPDANEPCLLYRDEGGVIRSLNAGSIQKVAQAIANLAFNDIVSLRTDPFILVLAFQRTPPENTKEYLRFCSKVAKQLNPLIPYFLGQAPEGVYNRQAKQDELLYTAITNLERKVILMSNIDTSIFRNPKSVGLQNVPNTEDLDFMVHLRLYSNTDSSVGATTKATQKQFPRGYLETYNYYKTIPDKVMRETLERNRIRWAIAVPSVTQVPEVKPVKTMLEKLGVQSIALPLYIPGNTEVLDLWKTTGWIPKPADARFTQPAPFKPLAPSTKLNANQGQLAAPKL